VPTRVGLWWLRTPGLRAEPEAVQQQVEVLILVVVAVIDGRCRPQLRSTRVQHGIERIEGDILEEGELLEHALPVDGLRHITADRPEATVKMPTLRNQTPSDKTCSPNSSKPKKPKVCKKHLSNCTRRLSTPTSRRTSLCKTSPQHPIRCLQRRAPTRWRRPSRQDLEGVRGRVSAVGTEIRADRRDTPMHPRGAHRAGWRPCRRWRTTRGCWRGRRWGLSWQRRGTGPQWHGVRSTRCSGGAAWGSQGGQEGCQAQSPRGPPTKVLLRPLRRRWGQLGGQLQ
jgi:hypothetical protein